MTSDLDSLLFHLNALRLPLQGVIKGAEALSSPLLGDDQVIFSLFEA